MTIKQKLCLLTYLGYYVGEINDKWTQDAKIATTAFQKDFGGIGVDGIFGAETEKATKHAVAYGMPVKKENKDWWKDIRFFTKAEFKCKCGGKHCNGYPAEMQEKVVRIADNARAYFNAPATVVSGLRCKTHNANEGGVANSRHMSGKAIDLRIKGVSADTLLAYIQKQPGVRYAYKINSTNVHFDIE